MSCIDHDTFKVGPRRYIGTGIRVRELDEPADCSQPCPHHEVQRDFLEVNAVLGRYRFVADDAVMVSLHPDEATCKAAPTHGSPAPDACIPPGD